MIFVIIHKEDRNKYWANARGWVGDAGAETFKFIDGQRLPNNGRWMAIPRKRNIPMSRVMTFEDLRFANVQRSQEWDPDNKLTAAFRGLELSGEVGELCNLVKKFERERLGIPGSRATFLQLAQELGDVQTCLDLLAMHYSIDLGEATRTTFNNVSSRMELRTRIE